MYKVLEISPNLPISLETAKQHLRLGDATHDDAIISLKLAAALDIAERYTNRFIIARTLEISATMGVCIDTTDLGEAVRVEYLAADGVRKEMSNEDWGAVGISSGTYVHIYKQPEDTTAAGVVKCWVITEAGYTDQTIPRGIAAAVLLMLGNLYENESDEIVGRSVSTLSMTARSLLQLYRLSP